jgi:S-layer homology domain
MSRCGNLLIAAGSAMLVGFLAQPAWAQSAPEFTDLRGRSMEAAAIKNLVSQGVMSAAAPGKFDPEATMKRGDFAVALQRLFQLPQPSKPTKFSDVRQGDALYEAVQAVVPFMDKQVPCPNCELGSKFEPAKSVSRALWAVTVVRILVAQNRLQLLNEAQTETTLSSVPDARDLRKRARPYFATAIHSGVIGCCAGNTLEMSQFLGRADVAEMLNKIQEQFKIPPAQPGA